MIDAPSFATFERPSRYSLLGHHLRHNPGHAVTYVSATYQCLTCGPLEGTVRHVDFTPSNVIALDDHRKEAATL